MKPLVVIPTYNERENVPLLVERILQLPERFEILFVDDGSPDQTGELIREIQNRPSTAGRVHLMERPKKMGLGSAYRDGFSWALKKDFDPICQMDADFSHDPGVLSVFVSHLSKVDLVLGSRYIPMGKTVGWPWHRNLLSRTANVYARLLTRSHIHDLTGGFKGYKRNVLQAMQRYTLKAEGYAFQIETTTVADKLGFTIGEVPITFKDREYGKSKLSRKVVWEAVFAVIRLAIFKLR